MEKRRFGPKLKMDALSKGDLARVKFLSLPKEVETPFDTGYGPNKNLKWEMEIDLLSHPTQDVLGKMVWETTASVIRLDIAQLMVGKDKKALTVLLEDLQTNDWYIMCDRKGQYSIKEI